MPGRPDPGVREGSRQCGVQPARAPVTVRGGDGSPPGGVCRGWVADVVPRGARGGREGVPGVEPGVPGGRGECGGPVAAAGRGGGAD